MKTKLARVVRQYWLACLGVSLTLVIIGAKQWAEVTGWAKLSQGFDAQRMLVMIQEMLHSGSLARTYLFDLDRTLIMGPYPSGFQLLIVILSAVTGVNASIFVLAAQVVFILVACALVAMICRDTYANPLVSVIAPVLIAISITQVHPTPHYFATFVLAPYLLYAVNRAQHENSQTFFILAGIIFCTLVLVHSVTATVTLALLLGFFMAICPFKDRPVQKRILFLSVAMVGFYFWRFILWGAEYNYASLGDALYSYTNFWGLRVSKELSVLIFFLLLSIPIVIMAGFTYYGQQPWAIRFTWAAQQAARQMSQQLAPLRPYAILIIAFIISVGFIGLALLPISRLQQAIDIYIFKGQTFSPNMFTPNLLLLPLVILAWSEGLTAKEALFALPVIPLFGAVVVSASGRLPPEGPLESFMNLSYLFVIVFGSKGLARCIELAREPARWWVSMVPVIVFALVLPISLNGLQQTTGQVGAVRASLWLYRQLSADGYDKRIGTNSSYIRSFVYIRPEDVFFPWEGSQPADLVNFACSHDLDYLILWEADARWIAWLDQIPRFEQVYNRDSAVIYIRTAVGACDLYQ